MTGNLPAEILKVVKRMLEEEKLKGANRYIIDDLGRPQDIIRNLKDTEIKIGDIIDTYATKEEVEKLLDELGLEDFEDIQSAIDSLNQRITDLENNPSGATAEQVQQINKNTTDISNLQGQRDNDIIYYNSRFDTVEQELSDHETRITSLEQGSSGGGTTPSGDIERKLSVLTEKVKQQDINLIKESLSRRIADEAVGFQGKPTADFTDLVTDTLDTRINIINLENCLYDSYFKLIHKTNDYPIHESFYPFSSINGIQSHFYWFDTLDEWGWVRPAYIEVTKDLRVYIQNGGDKFEELEFPDRELIIPPVFYDFYTCYVKRDNVMLAILNTPTGTQFLMFDFNNQSITDITTTVMGNMWVGYVLGIYFDYSLNVFVIVEDTLSRILDLQNNTISESSYSEYITSARSVYWDQNNNTFYVYSQDRLIQISLINSTLVQLNHIMVNNSLNVDLSQGFSFVKDNYYYIYFSSGAGQYSYKINLIDGFLSINSTEKIVNKIVSGKNTSMFIEIRDPYNPDNLAYQNLAVGGLLNPTTEIHDDKFYVKDFYIWGQEYNPDDTFNQQNWAVETQDRYTSTPLDLVYSYVGYSSNSHGELTGVQYSRDWGQTWSPISSPEEIVDISDQPPNNVLRIKMIFRHNAHLAMFGFGGMPK